MSNYAYLDRHGILHVNSEQTARQGAANGRVEKVDFETKSSYPVVGGQEVVVYGVNHFNYSNEPASKRSDTEKVHPELAALYKRLM